MADSGDSSSVVKIIVVTTLLTFIPALVLSVTSFTRILIVFAFLKQGLGTPHVPPAPVLITLALILTTFVSAPLLRDIHQAAYEPYESGELSGMEALARLEKPLRAHLQRRVTEADVAVFAELRGDVGYHSIDQVPILVLVPAFMLGELRIAFRLGFSLLVPFVLIDLIVAAMLMTLGMMMLPPILISLPIKILIFVTIDGWTLLVSSLARGAM